MPTIIPTRTDSIRVWSGFRRPALPQQDFIDALGDTFVPGTLTMLKPYGISAYLVAVLRDDIPGLPGESALVVYNTPEHYRAVTRDNLRGRVHRASHFAVFDMDRSRATFPVPASATAAECVFLYDRDIDWQAARVVFSLYAVTVGVTPATVMTPALPACRTALDALPCQQAIVVMRDGFVAIWTAFDPGSTTLPAVVTAVLVPALPADVTPARSLAVEPMACFGDDAELMTFTRDRAVQFRFPRAATASLF